MNRNDPTQTIASSACPILVRPYLPTLVGSHNAPIIGSQLPAAPNPPERTLAEELEAARQLIETNSDARMVFLSQPVNLVASFLMPAEAPLLLARAVELERAEPPGMDLGENEVRRLTLDLNDAFLQAQALLAPPLAALRNAHLLLRTEAQASGW